MKNHRLEFLRKKSLNDSLTSKSPIELIVKTNFQKRDWLAKELDRVGHVTRVYDSIPYLSFVSNPEDAKRLTQTFTKFAEDTAYKSIVSAISVIDVSNTFNTQSTTAVSSGLWNLENIGAYKAQQFANGSGTSIAIIDTGVDYNHPEVSRNFGSKKGYDFIKNDSDPLDLNGHGTHVAGIAFGKNYGIALGVTSYAVRVLNENGAGTEADTIAGLDWAAKNQIDVINLSLGSPYASTALEDMCYYLANKGALIVAAAGNTEYGPNYPASFGDPVIAVAAVDNQNQHANFSNIYETNDISAPGVNITSSYQGSYATLSGTSMASPHVAGGLTLALSAMKNAYDLEQVMGKTAQSLDSGIPQRDVYGAGLLRLDLMVQSVMEKRTPNLNSYGAEILSVLKEVLWD